jgi:hypothetical protein
VQTDFITANHIAITPSVQYLINPVANPKDVWLFGLRMRLTF